jgi:hypothetical protein
MNNNTKIKNFLQLLKNYSTIYIYTKDENFLESEIMNSIFRIYEEKNLKYKILTQIEYMQDVSIDFNYLEKYSLIVIDFRISIFPASEAQKNYFIYKFMDLINLLKTFKSKRVLFVSDKSENETFSKLPEILKLLKVHLYMPIIKI